MTAKRMRVFAGPNGSGKTTIFKGILAENQVNLGVYVNADDIEASLKKESELDFFSFGLTITQEVIQDYFKQSTFAPVKRKEADLFTKIKVQDNILTTSAVIDSYLSADLAEFIRQQLLENEISFTYETVMSHPDKIDFLKLAQEKGFRVYLYYIATEDPEINISRVKVRVAQNGHYVDPEIIKNRYYKSLNNLKKAVKQTNRAYIFDNTHDKAKFIAEITEGVDVVLNVPSHIPSDTPNWVAEYLSN